MFTVNGSAIAQSAISLVAGLSFLEAIREIPNIYADGTVSHVAYAKIVLAVVILCLVILMIWCFSVPMLAAPAATEDHKQPAMINHVQSLNARI